MTEMAVMAAVLIPLFLLIPVVAKYGHIQQMAQQAARNAAWEASVSSNYALPNRAQAEREALDRNFALADARIRSNVPTGNGNGEFGDAMLGTFSGRKLLERDNLQVRRITQTGSPGRMDDALAVLPRVGRFPPNSNGYVTSEVQLNIRDLKLANGSPARYLQPFDNLNLVLDRKQTLLVDAWNASGPRSGARSVVNTIKPLAPTSNLSGLDKVLDMFKPLEFLPVIGAIGKIELGTVEPDIVPADKLAEYPVR
ncbi:MAG: pilus assembly protein [Burkholderiales bacterium]|nr:MAG: pilus assembly protein [Burkholderiales bacterium]